MKSQSRLVIAGQDLSPPADGVTFPPGAFTSPEVFELEQRAIFARSWVHVADLVDVAQPGDYVAASIGRTPVLIIRGHDGTLRAFLNACRHRGATIAEGKGHCERQLRCPYHAWSYGSDGRLIGLPHRDQFACKVENMGLIPVRLEALGPMLFACLDADAPPLSQWAGQLPAALEAAGAGELQPAFSREITVSTNWKIFVENALDAYHVQFVHDLFAEMVAANDSEHFFEERSSYSLVPLKPGMFPPELVAQVAHLRIGNLFPNLICVLSPFELTYVRVDPIGPEQSRLVARSFDRGESPIISREFRQQAFDRTTEQDIAVVERVQRGLHAHGLPRGVYASQGEARIGHFERMVALALARAAGA